LHQDLEHNTTTVNEPALSFGWLDYSMFGSMLVISTVIGIYFGCFGTRQRTKNEYLMGNKNMSVFPIAMSLTASHISGITLLGAPSEMYTFGTQYWMMCLAACIVCAVVAVAYMPVFYTLQITSTYEVRYLLHVASINHLLKQKLQVFNITNLQSKVRRR
jgi:Na+/pantothenate symporter